MTSSAHREELLVFDQEEACAYLPNRIARLPLRWPLGIVTRAEMDERWAAGDRRSGFYLYRPHCPSCSACEALRIAVDRFRPSRTQQRIERRGLRLLQVTLGDPHVDETRVRLFNEHRIQRGLGASHERLDETAYKAFLVDTCCETFEISYRVDGQLVAVAICDRGRLALSAVYCYYDVAFSRLSPGVFSILTQIQLCRDWHMRYVYLGYYVAGSPHMSYKAQYRPHERLVSGSWRQESGERRAESRG